KAINREIFDAIAALMQQANTDPKIRTIVLSSSHRKVLSADADLGALHEVDGYMTLKVLMKPGACGLPHSDPAVPVIVVVEGAVLGGGFEIALAAGILVASTSAGSGLPEAQVEILAATGGAIRLPHQLPAKISVN